MFLQLHDSHLVLIFFLRASGNINQLQDVAAGSNCLWSRHSGYRRWTDRQTQRRIHADDLQPATFDPKTVTQANRDWWSIFFTSTGTTIWSQVYWRAQDQKVVEAGRFVSPRKKSQSEENKLQISDSAVSSKMLSQLPPAATGHNRLSCVVQEHVCSHEQTENVSSG